MRNNKYKINGQEHDQPATKDFVHQEIQGLRQDLPKIVNSAVSDVIKDEFSKVKEEIGRWKNGILKSNDKVAQEYKTFETEKAALSANYQKLEKRVEKLEKAVY